MIALFIVGFLWVFYYVYVYIFFFPHTPHLFKCVPTKVRIYKDRFFHAWTFTYAYGNYCKKNFCKIPLNYLPEWHEIMPDDALQYWECFNIQSFQDWICWPRGSPVCAPVCVCVCVRVCLSVSASHFHNSWSILTWLGPHDLNKNLRWYFSQNLKILIWWRHNGCFVCFSMRHSHVFNFCEIFFKLIRYVFQLIAL